MGTALKPEDLVSFRKKLLALRARLQGDLSQMGESAFQGDGQGMSGNLSNVPTHLADLGSETFEQDLTLGLIETEQATLAEVDRALDRIETGLFGKCHRCGGAITKARLEAIPQADTCLPCAVKEETH